MQRHFDLTASLVELSTCGIHVTDVRPVLVIHGEARKCSGGLSVTSDELILSSTWYIVAHFLCSKLEIIESV
jgi:hypothetical protein